MQMTHHYFHDPTITDLAKIRQEASYRIRDSGENSAIHFHKHDDQCNTQCYVMVETESPNVFKREMLKLDPL